MADETTLNKRPLQLVQLKQSRCSNTFGVSPCTASGTPKCAQMYGNCLDKENYNTDASITWQFCRPQDKSAFGPMVSVDGDDVKTELYDCLVSASTSSSTINIGAAREAESPLGVNATASATFQSPPFRDMQGVTDFYTADRTTPDPLPPFWSVWWARNRTYPNATFKILEGYGNPDRYLTEADLDDFQERLFDLANVSGPGSSSEWTLTARDPMDKLYEDFEKYPPTSDIDLSKTIGSSRNTVPVTCAESEISDTLGNVSEYYIRIGDEIIQYDGYTGTAPDFVLTNCTRNRFSTSADGHDELDAVQRVAVFSNLEHYKIAREIIETSTIPDSYIDGTVWDDEGGTYLFANKCDLVVLSEPEDRRSLVGELCRDGLFSIWWDDRRQTIPLLPVRPPRETPETWTDKANILQGGFSKKAVADEVLTRTSVLFGVRDHIGDMSDIANYNSRQTYIDSDMETEEATGQTIIENLIYSRWISARFNALALGASLSLRYRLPPEYATVSIDARDRATQMGDVIDMTTRQIVDIDGHQEEQRWQVTALDEVTTGHMLEAILQSYQYVGKFGIIMEDDAPDYADATEDERLSGCWIADDTDRLMPDDTEPYFLQ